MLLCHGLLVLLGSFKAHVSELRNVPWHHSRVYCPIADQKISGVGLTGELFDSDARIHHKFAFLNVLVLHVAQFGHISLRVRLQVEVFKSFLDIVDLIRVGIAIDRSRWLALLPRQTLVQTVD